MMRSRLVVTAFVCGLVVGIQACGGTSSTTTSAPDAGTGGTSDSGAVADGGGSVTDAGASTPPCSDCVTGTLAWGPNGGNGAYQDESSLAACRDFQHERLPAGGSGGPASLACTTPIGGCNAGQVAVGDVERALAHPDVVAALAAAKTPVYGSDGRPADGTVFRITRNGKSIDVGGACASPPGSSCIPIPPGVGALASVLKALDQQELAKPACDAFD